MKHKKKIMIVTLASAMVLGVAFAINSTMSYAKNYNELNNKDSNVDKKETEKRIIGEPINYVTIDDIKCEVVYKDGIDIEEGITAIKGIEQGIRKIKETYGEDIYINEDIYTDTIVSVYVWDYDAPTILESKSSWGISYTITVSGKQTRIDLEVDKHTGTCVEKDSKISDTSIPVTVGKYSIYLREPNIDFDFNEGVTVEKAISILQEKGKQLFNINIVDKAYLSVWSNQIENKVTWQFGMALTPGPESDDLVYGEIDKTTGEIISFEFQSSEKRERLIEFQANEEMYWGKNIDTEADGATVKARALEYLAEEKNSKYHQIAIDFVKKNNLNQGANIVKAQTVLERCNYMLWLESEIDSLKYLVEVELDNGKYIIVMIEKEVDIIYGYQETSVSFAKRLDFWVDSNDEQRKYREERYGKS